MSSEAVTARLLSLSQALATRGFTNKGVDMSTAAVTARLDTLAALSNMCWHLMKIGDALPFAGAGGAAQDGVGPRLR